MREKNKSNYEITEVQYTLPAVMVKFVDGTEVYFEDELSDKTLERLLAMAISKKTLGESGRNGFDNTFEKFTKNVFCDAEDERCHTCAYEIYPEVCAKCNVKDENKGDRYTNKDASCETCKFSRASKKRSPCFECKSDQIQFGAIGRMWEKK